MVNKQRVTWILVLLAVALLVMPVAAKGLTGTFYTTTEGCEGGRVTQFEEAEEVYLFGSGKGNMLPDGSYFVRVTSPDGMLLGASASANVVVADGEFDDCYQLWALVKRASTGGAAGWDLTSVPGGIFKVWLSPDEDFASAKTHSFQLEAAKATARADSPTVVPADDEDDDDDEDGKGRGPGINLRGWQKRFQDLFDRIRQLRLSRRPIKLT